MSDTNYAALRSLIELNHPDRDDAVMEDIRAIVAERDMLATPSPEAAPQVQPVAWVLFHDGKWWVPAASPQPLDVQERQA